MGRRLNSSWPRPSYVVAPAPRQSQVGTNWHPHQGSFGGWAVVRDDTAVDDETGLALAGALQRYRCALSGAEG